MLHGLKDLRPRGRSGEDSRRKGKVMIGSITPWGGFTLQRRGERQRKKLKEEVRIVEERGGKGEEMVGTFLLSSQRNVGCCAFLGAVWQWKGITGPVFRPPSQWHRFEKN